MKEKIDSGFDTILNVEYDLIKTDLSELKTLTKSWYGDIVFSNFDGRYVRVSHENDLVEMKKIWFG